WFLKEETELKNRPCTLGINMLTIDKLNVNAIDCSGLRVFRKILWPQALRMSDLVVFVIDASTPEKLKEVREALTFVCEEIKGQKPILFLASKNDILGAISPKIIADELNLRKLECPWLLKSVSAARGINLQLMELFFKKLQQ
ncbi:MAG: ADP-ribosylation factor-like protein, partial [Candidatus Hodarchaeota archaeon]